MADLTSSASPFPGMDPYLEQRWPGVHTRLITYLADTLSPRLPDGLEAEPQERVFIETVGGPDRWFAPDVHVYRSSRAATPPAPVTPGERPSRAGVPMLIEVPTIEVVEPYIEIVDAKSGGRVVTVVEIVSPSNKAVGPGRRKYLRKQRDLRRSTANLVEIDLIRGGKPVTLGRPAVVPPDGRTAYHVVVRRAGRRTPLEYYPCPLRDRLPVVDLPLRPGDPDLAVDVQQLVSHAYANGGYAAKLDYTRPLRPPLGSDDAAWATGLVAGRAGAPST